MEQNVSFTSYDGQFSIHCTFCGKLIAQRSPDSLFTDHCPHTIFVASEEGFYYRHDGYAKEKGIADKTDKELEIDSWDDFTDDTVFFDSMKITFNCQEPDKAGFSLYVGFGKFMAE